MVETDLHIHVKNIVDQFEISGEFDHAEPINVGHINDTILVKTVGDNDPDYVIQRINHDIFKDVDKLMENILRVTKHISHKVKKDGDIKQKNYVELVISKSGKYYFTDLSGNHWRCYVYCRNGSAESNVITPLMAFEGGRALGKFQHFLSDLPGGPLHETIPGFHNLKYRIHEFNKALAVDKFDRAKNAVNEIESFIARSEEMLLFYQQTEDGTFPVRVTHNDTKFNNILFDENSNALCIIDLDTVMNGYVLYDFGDAIRTLTNTTEEDDPDIEKVDFNFRLFEEFSHGYLTETRAILTQKEIEHLAFSTRMMTYIIALRFLIDYLTGDPYYKTTYANHNLDRTRNQLRLLEIFEENYEGLVGVIQKYAIV
jgi:Ser/Thr protein kinase RdoA (MazF antagonist)